VKIERKPSTALLPTPVVLLSVAGHGKEKDNIITLAWVGTVCSAPPMLSVAVAMSLEEAEAAVSECFSGPFGAAGSTVLIEEYLTGPECSLLAFTDGTTVAPMVPAQDHRRALASADAGML